MLKRKAMHYIKKWVDSKNKKCLVIQGARQTGKTYIVERFAEENYEEIAVSYTHLMIHQLKKLWRHCTIW